MKLPVIILTILVLAGCGKEPNVRHAEMLHKFAQADAEFIKGIAAANSNEMADVSNTIDHYSNLVATLELSRTNYADASNQLNHAIDEYTLVAASDLEFFQQAARAKRAAITNKLLQAKLSFFVTNQAPDAEDAISNDITSLTVTMASNLYLLRSRDVQSAGINELGLLISQITNSPPVQSNPPLARARYYQSVYQQPAQRQQTIDGIPADVYAQIKDAAIAKWPGDYEMQSYEIKKQVAAWHEVNP